MFKLLWRLKNGNDLLTSQLYDEQSFYDAFTKDLRRAQSKVIIESPYLTQRRALQFSKVLRKLKKRGVRVIVNTRHPKSHDKLLEIQSWLAIRVFRESGAKVRFHSDMRHRKLAAIDGEILWEGSLNIFSQSNSREIMRRTRSAVLCQQMLHFTGINRWIW